MLCVFNVYGVFQGYPFFFLKFVHLSKTNLRGDEIVCCLINGTRFFFCFFFKNTFINIFYQKRVGISLK